MYQYLLGKVSTSLFDNDDERFSYQYLLGKVSTNAPSTAPAGEVKYQYLLGKVSTGKRYLSLEGQQGINIY